MKIKYVSEITLGYCCKEMEKYMEKTSYIYYNSKGVYIDMNFYASRVHIDYCPFCGEKIEFITK